MAIKINGVTVIDDSRNLIVDSITYSSGGTQTEPSSGGSSITKTATILTLLHTIQNPNSLGSADNDSFGSSLLNGIYYGNPVAMSNGKILVGAQAEEGPGLSDIGAGYIFDAKSGSLLHTLRAQSLSTGESFGFTVAMSPNYAAISAYGSSVGGSVLVYSVETGVLLYTISNPNSYSSTTDDRFGFSMAIHNDTLVVGAYNEEEYFAFNAFNNSGVVYVFNLSTGQYVNTINNPNSYSTRSNDNFGLRVAINEKYIAVGAPGEDPYLTEVPSKSDSGVVHIFNRSTCEFLRTIAHPDSDSSAELFGSVIDLQGDYLVVGVPWYATPGIQRAGLVYVFNASSGGFVTAIGSPSTYDPQDRNKFGYQVKVYDNKIYALSLDDSSVSFTSPGGGSLWVHNLTTGAVLGNFQNPNTFGASTNDMNDAGIAVDGNYLAVTAPYEDTLGTNSGVLYVYNTKDTYSITNVDNISLSNGYSFKESDDIFSKSQGCTLLHTITNPNAYSTKETDFFGNAVGISGKYIIASAHYEDSSQGTQTGIAYIFDTITGSLIYTLNNPNAFSTASNDLFGTSVAISDRFAAVGAYFEKSAPNNANSGVVYVYDLNSGVLLHTISNPNVYSTSTNDEFSRNIKISGNYLLVGAPGEDASNNKGGKIYVYDINSAVLLSTINNPSPFSSSFSFGQYFDVFESILVVGCPSDTNFSPAITGVVHVIDFIGNQVLFTINNPNSYSTGSGDQFGESLTISEKYIVVGAPGEDSINSDGTGIVYVFNLRDGSLFRTINNPQPDQDVNFVPVQDSFGRTIGISGKYCIITSVEQPNGLTFIFNIETGELLHTIIGISYSISVYNNLFVSGSPYSSDSFTGETQSGKVSLFSITDISNIDKLLTLV